jgi:hypothetical protein
LIDLNACPPHVENVDDALEAPISPPDIGIVQRSRLNIDFSGIRPQRFAVE